MKRTQAFSYRRLVVIVKGTLLLSQELVSKQESHLKYIFRPLKGTFASRFPRSKKKFIVLSCPKQIWLLEFLSNDFEVKEIQYFWVFL